MRVHRLQLIILFALAGLPPVAARQPVIPAPGLQRSTPRAQGSTRRRAGAQSGVGRSGEQGPAQPQSKDELAALRDEFVRLTGEYKKSLGELLPHLERNVHQAEEDYTKIKNLYEAGLESRRRLEASEQTLAEAKAKVAETEQQMRAADAQVAETLVEAEAEKQAAKQLAKAQVTLPRGRLTQVGSYLRYTGAGFWSITNAWKVQQFFAQRFGRPLPVSAFGQTILHNRLGFDHHNSMDVPLYPNSAEGQALISFLRANGIPFTAFTAAIPGAATGPHIHVGSPSHRIAPSTFVK